MSEWTVVVVVGGLVSLGAAVIRPVVSLTRAITRLTVTVDELQKDAGALARKNSDSHEKLWRHNQKQDERLDNHERRLHDMERREG